MVFISLSSEIHLLFFLSSDLLTGPDVGKTLLFHPSDLPPSFVSQLEQCSGKFTNYQLKTIEENLKLYKNIDNNRRKHIDNVRYQCVETYIRRCQLRSIKRHKKLMQNYSIKVPFLLCYCLPYLSSRYLLFSKLNDAISFSLNHYLTQNLDVT